jgi:hypothetical protein
MARFFSPAEAGSYRGMRSWNSYFGFGFLLYTVWLELLENMI